MAYLSDRKVSGLDHPIRITDVKKEGNIKIIDIKYNRSNVYYESFQIDDSISIF